MIVPQNGCFRRDNRIKTDDDWGYPYFKNTDGTSMENEMNMDDDWDPAILGNFHMVETSWNRFCLLNAEFCLDAEVRVT